MITVTCHKYPSNLAARLQGKAQAAQPAWSLALRNKYSPGKKQSLYKMFEQWQHSVYLTDTLAPSY